MQKLITPILLLYFILFSSITFILWGVDKYRARAKQWRIPERTLLTISFLGGSFGALAGMMVFRHKIRKPIFWVVVGLAGVLHLLGLLYFEKY